MSERLRCMYGVTDDEDFTLHQIVDEAVAAAEAANDHQKIVSTKKLQKRIRAEGAVPKKAHAHGEVA